RDRLLAPHHVFPHRDSPLIGRDLEISMAERAVLDAAAGVNRTLIISGEAGAGKSSFLAAIAARAAEPGFLAGPGTAAPVEGAWPPSRGLLAGHGPGAPVGGPWRIPRAMGALAGLGRQDPGRPPGRAGPPRDETARARNGTPARGPGRAPTSGSSSPRPNWSSW